MVEVRQRVKFVPPAKPEVRQRVKLVSEPILMSNQAMVPAVQAILSSTTECPPQPAQWPNGALVFERGTAHMKGSDGGPSTQGLLGAVYRDATNGYTRQAAWKYNRETNAFHFIGYFPSCHEAIVQL